MTVTLVACNGVYTFNYVTHVSVLSAYIENETITGTIKKLNLNSWTYSDLGILQNIFTSQH